MRECGDTHRRRGLRSVMNCTSAANESEWRLERDVRAWRSTVAGNIGIAITGGLK
jgi:hypothetical protein